MRSATIVFGSLATALLLAAIYLSSSPIVRQNISQSFDSNIIEQEDNANSKLTFLVVGDYGWPDSNVQRAIALEMNEVAEQFKAEFVVSCGDNFYDPDGVSSVDDPSWDTHWRLVFQTQPYLSNLNWYGSIGNHDYNNTGLLSEFAYHQAGWKLDNFYYTHKHQVGNSRVAFVHVDTNYLAYGPEGYSPIMAQWFEKLGYTSNEQQVELAQQQLEKVKNYEWIFTAGHHMIGGDCKAVENTNDFLHLFYTYNVSSYLHGHRHSLDYRYRDNIAFIGSGAAGSAEKVCKSGSNAYPTWYVEQAYGFAIVTLTETLMNTEFFYSTDLKTWQSTKLPPTPKNTFVKN